MKKYIITSVCTLVLSLIGALGAGQNSLSLENELIANPNTTGVEQNVTGREDLNFPADIETTATDNTSKDTDAVKADVTPTQIDKEDASVNTTEKTKVNEETNLTSNNNKEAKVEAISLVKVASAKVEAPSQSSEPAKTDVVSKPVSKVQAQTVSYTAPQTNNNNVAKATANTPNLNSYSTKNGQVIVYKGVNLSNCKSANDVLSTLQKNGVNINSGNIQNITGLKDILSLIQKGQTTNGGSNTTTPTPTKAPTATPTKAPTATPTKAPTPAPTKAPTPTNNSGISSYANQVLQLVNAERAKAGLSAFTTNTALTSAANTRAKETVQSFSHTRPNGSSFSTVLKEYNISYRAAGENIAYGQRTPQEVVTGWMNSPGHRANILNSNFGKIGIGVYQASNGTIYWSQEFTN